MVFYCVVPMCGNNGTTTKMHRFPGDEELCEAWINRIKGTKLQDRNKARIRRNCRICDLHFSEEYRIIGRRGANLRVDSIPSLHLPYYTPPDEEPKDDIITISKFLSLQASMSQEEIQRNSPIEVSREERVTPPSPSQGEIQVSTPKSRKDLRKGLNMLQSIGAREEDLSPKAKNLYKMAENFRRTAERLETECNDLKAKLKEAQKVIESAEFTKAHLNKMTYKFIMAQLRLQRLSPKGQRLSLEDKMLALSLLNQSPKGYRLLRKIFAVPSRKTLTNLLQKVPFNRL